MKVEGSSTQRSTVTQVQFEMSSVEVFSLNHAQDVSCFARFSLYRCPYIVNRLPADGLASYLAYHPLSVRL
jgi:hypothetical protein